MQRIRVDSLVAALALPQYPFQNFKYRYGRFCGVLNLSGEVKVHGGLVNDKRGIFNRCSNGIL